MTLFDLDALDYLSPRDWLSDAPAPAHLRDYRFVLQDAFPATIPDREQYAWLMAGDNWHGVNPPLGFVPGELVRDIIFLTRFNRFETVAGALAALETAIVRAERTKEKEGKS